MIILLILISKIKSNFLDFSDERGWIFIPPNLIDPLFEDKILIIVPGGLVPSENYTLIS